MSEERKILEMIEKGQITADDGMKLLDALKSVTPEIEVEEPIAPTKPKKEYKFLKIRVITDDGDTKVNVNVPLKLLTAVGGLIPHINNCIPEDVKINLGEQGINLSGMPIDKILDAIVSGDLEDPTLVDVETNEGADSITTVKIYVD